MTTPADPPERRASQGSEAELSLRQAQAAGVDALIGKTLGGCYLIEAVLADGGMGRVYRGRHLDLDIPIAVKCVARGTASLRAATERFLVEGAVLRTLDHPNIVRVYDFGAGVQRGTGLFLVMELLEGTDLAARLESGVLPSVAWTVRTAEQILLGLGHAHSQGVVHRDMKPENILLQPLPDGTALVKLIDFGIAHVVGISRMTAEGQLVGTPHYMAPEQIEGRAVDGRADLYAVGVLLFEMLTGQRPFERDSLSEVFAAQLAAPRPDPRAVAPYRGISAALAEVCERALAIRPDERFQSASEMLSALHVALGGYESASRGSRTQAFARTELYLPQGESPAGGSRTGSTATAAAMAEAAALSVPLGVPGAVLTPVPYSQRPVEIREVQSVGARQPPLRVRHDPIDDHDRMGSAALDALAIVLAEARRQLLAGESDAEHRFAALARRMGAELNQRGEYVTAAGILEEALEHVDPRQAIRLALMEELVVALRARGQADRAALVEEQIALAAASSRSASRIDSTAPSGDLLVPGGSSSERRGPTPERGSTRYRHAAGVEGGPAGRVERVDTPRSVTPRPLRPTERR